MPRILCSILALVLSFPPAIDAFAQSQTTTDGSAPIICPHGSLTSALTCTGSYCDDIAMLCDRNIREVRGVFWTPFVAQTNGLQTATCGSESGPSAFMSGIACSGDWCDDIALQCTTLSLFRADFGTCETIRFSEEQGLQRWPSPFHFPVSIRCSGTHCDDKILRACRLIRR